MPMTREERDALLVRYRHGAAEFRAAMADVTDAELDERAIEGEWTVREIAHHLADSELNSAIRLRRLIAEDDPVLQGYDEMTFVRRLHVTDRPIASSIEAAAAARASTLTILEALTEGEWTRTGTHPSRARTRSRRGSWTTPITRGITRSRPGASLPRCARVDTPPGRSAELAAPHMTHPPAQPSAPSAAPPAALPTRTAGRPL